MCSRDIEILPLKGCRAAGDGSPQRFISQASLEVLLSSFAFPILYCLYVILFALCIVKQFFQKDRFLIVFIKNNEYIGGPGTGTPSDSECRYTSTLNMQTKFR